MNVDEQLELVDERAAYVDALVEGPSSPRDLVDRLDASRSTVNRALGDLADAGLVERADGGYVATLAGRIALDRYRQYRRESRSLVEVREALAPLSVDASLSAAAVTDATAHTGSDAAPYRPLEALHRAVRDADRYRAALPALDDPRHVRLLYEHAVVDGDPAELVVDDDLFASLAREFPRRLAAMTDEPAFDALRGSVPEFGLVLVERNGDVTVLVVVFDDSGVAAVLENDTERAVEWARERFVALREDAETVDDALQQTPDGGVVTADPVADVAVSAPGLFVSLEREGFVRLSDDLFADRPVADPATAWRAGLDLPEVHTGYAVERRDDDGRTVTDRLLSTLRDGRSAVVLGPPGSGKSTTCKRVACEWYDGGDPVVYREGGRGHAVESVEDLVRTVESLDGHALVVVEDAVRPDADAVFDAVERLADRGDVSFLLDAREREWRDPPGTVPDDAAAAVEPVGMPRLLDRDCERLVEHFERTADTDVEVPLDELRASLREDGPDDGAVPSEAVLLLHRLATYADPLADTETTLEDDVAAVFDDLAAAGDRALDVGVLANVLNAAGLPVRSGYLHAVAGPDGGDAVDRALDHLDGRVLFDRADGAYRTVHESWSVAFLAHLRDAAGEAAADRFGRVVSALLALADDPARRERVERATDDRSGLERVATDPGGWADETVEAVYALGRERPQLAPLFDGGETGSVDLPDACSGELAPRSTVWLGRMCLGGGFYDRAERAFERLAADGAFAIERLLGLSRVARERSNYDAAAEHAAAALDRARAADRHRAVARASLELGQVAYDRSDYDAAADHVSAALDALDALDDPDRRLRARALRHLGSIAMDRADYETAREHYRDSLEIERELGGRENRGGCLLNLGTIAKNRGEFETAREYYERALELQRAAGDRKGASMALTNLGALARVRGDPERAREYYERSLDRKRELGDRHGVAKCRNNLGLVAKERGDFAAAREHFERSLAVKRDLGDRQGAAGTRLNLGILAMNRGALDDAIEHLDDARETFDELGVRRGVAEALRNRARTALLGGRLDDAAAFAERCRTVSSDIGARHREVGGTVLAGVVAMHRGRFREADAHLRAARDLAADLDAGRATAGVLLARGELDRRRGNLDDADAALSTALEHFDGADNRLRAADCQVALARVARDRGDLDAAADRASTALSTAGDLGAARVEVDALVVRGGIERRRGDRSAAASTLDGALATAREMGYRPGTVRAGLARGRLARDRDDPEAAASQFEEARDRASEGGHRPLAAAARAGLGGVALDRSDPATARNRLETAVEALREMGAVGRALAALPDLVAACEAAGDGAAAREWAAAGADLAAERGLDDRRERFEQLADEAAAPE